MKKLIFILLTISTLCFSAETVTYKLESIQTISDASDVVQGIRVLFTIRRDDKGAALYKAELNKEDVATYRDDPSKLKELCEKVIAEKKVAIDARDKVQAQPTTKVGSIDPATVPIDKAKIEQKIDAIKLLSPLEDANPVDIK